MSSSLEHQSKQTKLTMKENQIKDKSNKKFWNGEAIENGFIVYFRLVQNQTTVGMMVTQENVKVKTHQCQRE